MKRICILVSDVFSVGGCERVAVNLANSFCEKYKVSLISGFNRGKKGVYKLDPRVDVFYVVCGDTRLRNCYIKACKKLNKILSLISPDVTLLINTSSYVFLPAFWKIKTKCIACEHTNLKNEFHTSSFLKKIERLCAVLKCDKIVTLTKADVQNYISKYNISNQRVLNIYNWIEPEILNYYKVQDGESKKIISVGRFDKVKGYEMLVEIAKVVLNKHTDWKWHIYGAGENEYKEKIKQKIFEYHLEDKLILKEPINSIYEKYSEYSFLVLTSYYEGLPMALLEAKACGLPTIAFSCPTGPNEIIVDKKDGYLIPCYNISIMIDRIESLIMSKDKIHEFSGNSHKNIEKFEKSNILNQWEQLFEELC